MDQNSKLSAKIISMAAEILFMKNSTVKKVIVLEKLIGEINIEKLQGLVSAMDDIRPKSSL